MRDPRLAAVLSAIIPGVGQTLQRAYSGRYAVAHHHPGTVDRHGRPTRLGLTRHRSLHSLHLRTRPSRAASGADLRLVRPVIDLR